jgi:CubicO group peptidase (beta-lactamase class C family)
MSSGSSFDRTTPEAVGISSTAVLAFLQAVEDHEHPLDSLHGVMLLRHGKVAAEGWWAPYGPHLQHTLFSLSKSFASTAIGLAVAEGLLTADDPVLRFFPDDAPAHPSDRLRAMTVRHLLSMNTGHTEDTTGLVFRPRIHRNRFDPVASLGTDPDDGETWPKRFLSLPVERRPGSWFVYNTGATYMLSAIITRLTGETLVDYLRPRLFEPLGIENPWWETDPRGRSLGGTGLHITTDEIARFGQLYLARGVWNGRRLLSEEWIDEATFAHSDNSNTQTNPDWTVGYGYQFWRGRHGTYRGDGAFGQYCIVFPEHDALLAINSGVRDMQAVLDKVWQHLLPAMQADALPEDPDAQARLREKLASLTLSPAQGAPTSPAAERISGNIYRLAENAMALERVSLAFLETGSVFTTNDERGAHSVPVGFGSWATGRADLRGQGEEEVASSGAWIADDTYELRICFTAGEFGLVARFRFTGDDLQLTLDPSVSWVSPEITTIAGRTG